MTYNQKRGKKFRVRGMRGPNGALKLVKRNML